MDCNITVDAARAIVEAAGFRVIGSSLQNKPPKENDEVFTLYCLIAAALVLIAGLMSGLTLGLMSLDALDLEVRHVLHHAFAALLSNAANTHFGASSSNTHVLMSYTKMLQVLRRSGTEQEQKYAKKIEPVSTLCNSEQRWQPE